MLGRVIDRVKAVKGLDQVIVAVPDTPSNQPILDFCATEPVLTYAGADTNVLRRYMDASIHYGVRVIMRVTADCPVFDPVVAQTVLERFVAAQGAVSYVSNIDPPTFPDGLDTEVMMAWVLQIVWDSTDHPSYLEHVTSYLRQPHTQQVIHRANVAHDPDLSTLRMTADTDEDLQWARAIYAALSTPGGHFTLPDILTYLRAHPSLARRAPR